VNLKHTVDRLMRKTQPAFTGTVYVWIDDGTDESEAVRRFQAGPNDTVITVSWAKACDGREVRP
jgi:hypothetical protein